MIVSTSTSDPGQIEIHVGLICCDTCTMPCEPNVSVLQHAMQYTHCCYCLWLRFKRQALQAPMMVDREDPTMFPRLPSDLVLKQESSNLVIIILYYCNNIVISVSPCNGRVCYTLVYHMHVHMQPRTPLRGRPVVVVVRVRDLLYCIYCSITAVLWLPTFVYILGGEQITKRPRYSQAEHGSQGPSKCYSASAQVWLQ